MYKVVFPVIVVALIVFGGIMVAESFANQNDTVAGKALDVDGFPDYFTDGSPGSRHFLRLARMPEYLWEVTDMAEGNLYGGEVLHVICSKDEKSIIRTMIVDNRPSVGSSDPKDPLPTDRHVKARITSAKRPFYKEFPEGTSIAEVIDSLPFRITTLAKAN